MTRSRDNCPPENVTVRVLSIRQPHADLIVSGVKWCENRTWSTNHRGILFIHASSWDAAERAAWRAKGVDPAIELGLGCCTGAIIGFASVIDCVPVEDLDAIQRGKFSNRLKPLAEVLQDVPEDSWSFANGPFCWILGNPKPLPQPIVTKGKLNLWRFTTQARLLKSSEPPQQLKLGKRR